MLRYQKFEEKIKKNTELACDQMVNDITSICKMQPNVDEVSYTVKTYYAYKVHMADDLELVRKYNSDKKVYAINYIKLKKFGKKIPVFFDNLVYLLQMNGLELTFDYKGTLKLFATPQAFLGSDNFSLKKELK